LTLATNPFLVARADLDSTTHLEQQLLGLVEQPDYSVVGKGVVDESLTPFSCD